jgi:ABC-type Fe3+-hydroxamate transport system substrate-binding protein
MLIRFFAKVRSQAIQYGPWRSLKAFKRDQAVVLAQVWFWGGRKLIMILENAVEAEWFTTES